ncbi:BlaI/MecI/CopY family transcriptional regulator [Nonlabens sp. SCSIO 43208]|uniref:BlaI/MecI/CopY family transcriptional regulator n=1 Tax=Nonlabens sp. SCSIO 43208 TaxID=2793009 RepID=UPI003D6AF4D0
MKTLTPAEEDIMKILWSLGESNVAAIIETMPEPKPAYNTVSTIIRILENKEFVDHRKQGRGYIYFPIVSQTTYTESSASKLVHNYFKGSFKSMVSFFMEQEKLTISELEDVLKEIQKNKKS